MISKDELLNSANAFGISVDVAEKDYILGWFLAAINQDQELKNKWIFKGGTCLKKCFFDTYRFSEDLDFTLLDSSHLDENFLQSTFERISKWLYTHSGIEVPIGSVKFEIFKNPRASMIAQGRVAYKGPNSRKVQANLPRVKLDLLADEIVVTETIKSKINHPYSDYQEELFLTSSYSYLEIFAEKLRALSERGRPRDLYDVIYMYKNIELRPPASEIFKVLVQKCNFKQASLPTPDVVKNTDRLIELRADWNSMLSHQLQDLPSLDQYLDDLDQLLQWLFEDQQELL